MLEKRIEELTAAIVALTEVLLNPVPVPQVVSLVASEESQVVIEDPGHIDTRRTTIVVEDLPVDTAPAVSYDDVKNLVIAVSKVNKAKAVASLGRFGVKTAKELNEGQWADFVAYMVKVQAGEIDPEASN